jgi:pimeloyl-ACP methyl ester carboxylesterase
VVHLLVNALVALEPGATWSDHVLAAVIPTALVALAAIEYGRLGAGLRASLALLVGVIALVAGGVAAAGALRLGPSGDDWTGLLLLPAGVALVALGAWVLWVSRKRGGPAWRRIARRALLVLGALFVLYWVVLPLSFAIVATERPRDPVGAADLGAAHEDVRLRTADGLALSAWYVPSRNGAAVILYPRDWTREQARMLARNGYGVLLIDMRGYGDSGGDANAYGWGAARDIDAGVAYLRTRPDVEDDRVGGLGLSVGGEQMIDAAAGNAGLKAVVSEGAGLRSARESFDREGPADWELALQYPLDLMQTAAVWVLAGEAPPPSLKEQVARISPRAVFLIYGEDGQEIERVTNPVYYAAAGQPKELWEVPGAGHTGGLSAQPEEYERRVIAFFGRELLGRD